MKLYSIDQLVTRQITYRFPVYVEAENEEEAKALVKATPHKSTDRSDIVKVGKVMRTNEETLVEITTPALKAHILTKRRIIRK